MIVDMELIIAKMMGILADNGATIWKKAEYRTSRLFCSNADSGAAYWMPNSRICIGIRSNVFGRQSNGIFSNLCHNGIHGLPNMVYVPQIAQVVMTQTILSHAHIISTGCDEQFGRPNGKDICRQHIALIQTLYLALVPPLLIQRHNTRGCSAFSSPFDADNKHSPFQHRLCCWH